MEVVFWDSEGMFHVDFLPHDVTGNAQYCSNLLLNDIGHLSGVCVTSKTGFLI
jgi:hypothetical protein